MTLSDILLFAARLLAGIGVFLVGVHLLTSNIEQLATDKIRSLFSKTADHRLINVGIGAAATALIQSSSVSTVLIVGFVNVGVMNLYQAAAMIMGANIGTTVTAQIAALSTFPVTTYLQLLAFIGVLITMIAKRDSVKKVGSVLSGLGLIFIGLSIMSGSMEGGNVRLQELFASVSNPGILFLIGALLTALVQSSSAITSVIIAMSVAGVTIGSGGNEMLFIILGTNVGSCVTALTSSLTAGRNARRAGLIHLIFNCLGSLIFFAILLCFPGFMDATFRRWFSAAATQIAMFHTFFNVGCTLLFLPFCRLLVALSGLLVPEGSGKDPSDADGRSYLDERMLVSAASSIALLKKELILLLDAAMTALSSASAAFMAGDGEEITSASRRIGRAAAIGQGMTRYLIRLSASGRLRDVERVARLHESVGDALRISEIADNFLRYRRQAAKEQLVFSEAVGQGLGELADRLDRLYRLTVAMVGGRAGISQQLDDAEEEVDRLRRLLIEAHVRRLGEGSCRPESSSLFVGIVSSMERVGDHLYAIARSQEEPDRAASGNADAVGRGTVGRAKKRRLSARNPH